jgi:histidinol phosphatase-like enzyme
VITQKIEERIALILILSHHDTSFPAYLRPSRELLEYYRKKIADYDVEQELVVNKLEEYRKTYEEQVCH